MKFAVLALLGLVAGKEYKFPTIEWDQSKFDTAKKDWDAWAVRDQASHEQDNRATFTDLAHAYATYQTQVAVNYGRVVKPYEEMYVRYLDAITVNSTCNTEAASKCVYDTYGLHSYTGEAAPTQTPAQCFQAAGCHTKWDTLTAAQKQAAIQRYYKDKRVADTQAQQAFQRGMVAVKAKLDKAIIAHQRRCMAMKEDFNNTLMKTARDMNCNKPCIDNCSGVEAQRVPTCLSQCKCFEGVIKITPAHANYREVVESQYGDLENLTIDDYTNIFDSIEKSQMLI